jgi:Rho termination factor, N-terminal domain
MADKKKTEPKKSDQKKSDGKKVDAQKAELKKLEKSAQKAYVRAKEAVSDARQKAKKLDKSARSKVTVLEKQLDKPAKTLAAASTKPSSTLVDPTVESEPVPSIYTPPLPHADEEDAELEKLTLIALRSLAKKRGLTNYSQLNKAALIARIHQG